MKKLLLASVALLTTTLIENAMCGALDGGYVGGQVGAGFKQHKDSCYK